MNRFLAPLLLLLIVALLYLGWIALTPAQAHDWYSSTSDPVYQSNCCGGHDCAPVEVEWVYEVKEGYRLVMTLDQAKTVNPSATAPIDAIIPWSRVQTPPNAQHAFYACIYDSNRAPPRNGVICFFATPTM